MVEVNDVLVVYVISFTMPITKFVIVVVQNTGVAVVASI